MEVSDTLRGVRHLHNIHVIAWLKSERYARMQAGG